MGKLRKVCTHAAVAAVVAMGARSALAGVVTVPGDFPTIQAALDAPDTADGDEIVLSRAIYSGAGNIDLDWRGQAIVVRSAAGDPASCTIDCRGEGRGVIFQTGESSDAGLRGIRILDGAAVAGGGVLLTGGSDPTFEDCIIEQCVATTDGGGVLATGAAGRFVDCRFIDNNAGGAGGGMYVLVGDPVVAESWFEGNHATTSPLGTGGAIAVANGTLHLEATVLIDNEASAAGGGLYEVDAATTVLRSRFLGNRACEGAGWFVRGGDSQAINSVLAGNQAEREGGGVFAAAAALPRLVNCTVTENTAPLGGGGLLAAGGAVVTVDNGVVWGNTPDALGGGGRFSVQYSDVEEGAAGPGNIDADPLFVDPAGPDRIPGTIDDDHRPGPGAPVIDAGNNTLAADAGEIDLDGGTRFVDDPATADTGLGTPPLVDLGAHEFQPRPCPADLDGSGDVGFADLLLVLAAWAKAGGPFDLDGDGSVGFGDLLVILAQWGSC
ncbi:MAG: hypothetical protein HKN62_16145 [Phycisphaerales bacterium]|nr:hypothetical protein [Phycisphaerales bacterium]